MSWEIVNRPSTQEMAKIHEKGLTGLPSKTSFCTVDGPLNAFASSKDGSLIAVAGRSVFRIITLDQDTFKEKVNLRVGRINLNFSITDVQWHPVEDHILATAAGNGAIVIWNLNKITKQKQDLLFTEHKRTVNRIKFHPVESSLLLSAGQDGTMRCFDIRKQGTSIFTCHCKHVDVIRDIEFSPFDGKLFTAACETGNVQLWDMRRPDMYYHQFMAHNGPIFTLDWHPEERNWIATGGRDKFVKVWDVQSKAAPVMNNNGIMTITSVSRVKWRPQNKYQLASCSLLVDFDIHVWDIRRPYIPFATFSEHKDVPTGIMWRKTIRGHDPSVFLSCSKDSTIYQHMFSDAHHPADHAPPVAISMNVNGDLSYAKCDKLTHVAPPTNVSKVRNALHFPASSNSLGFQRKLHDISDNFTARSSSSLFVFTNNTLLRDDSFKVLAKSYKLSGRSFSELCEHNSKIASSLSLHKHAQTWSVLKTFYSENMESLVPSPKASISAVNSGGGLGTTLGNPEPQSGTTSTNNLTSNIQSSNVNTKNMSETITSRQTQDISAFQDDDDSSSSSSLDEVPKIMNIASGGNQDFLFGDDPDDGQFFFDDQTTLDDTRPDWTLPSEAFQPRQVFMDRPVSPRVEQEQERPESPASNVDSDVASASAQRSLLESNVSENPVAEDSSQALFLPKWDFTSLVMDVLNFFAEEGDAQMCASLLIVLGDRIRFKIDEQTQEHWLMSYIDLLGRQEMYSVANEIIKLSSLPVVNTQNQASTTVYTSCKRCNRPLVKSGWFCKRCQSLVEPCSLCHLTVKGSYVWCQGCGHGGHLTHIQEWFSTNIWCPTGCGHICEFT